MTDQKPSPPAPPQAYETDEIDLFELWQVIWRWRRMILYLCLAAVFVTAAASLFMTNIYEAKAVIVPVSPKEGGGGSSALAALAGQLGGGLPGIAIPGTATATEIVALLKSNILRERMIKRYNLMPVLFYKQWDAQKKTWKKGGISLNPLSYLSRALSSFQPQPPGLKKKDPDIPDIWDALRLLDKTIKVNYQMRDNTITVAVEFHDPEQAKMLVEYLLTTLTDHMSSEAKRVAETNRKYLEEQLAKTTDPLIKQKTYNLIAQQIETAMMAEVKENFAFKVIDPPLTPDKKIKPKRTMMVMIAFICALFIGLFLAFVLERFKNRATAQAKGLTKSIDYGT